MTDTLQPPEIAQRHIGGRKRMKKSTNGLANTGTRAMPKGGTMTGRNNAGGGSTTPPPSMRPAAKPKGAGKSKASR